MGLINLLRFTKSQGAADQDVGELLKKTLGDLSRLPMMPEVAIKAMAVAQAPGSSLAQLSGIIEKDMILATGVLRLANSSLYRVGRTIGSVDQAVVRLGLRECQNLIVTVGMRSLFRQVSPVKRDQAEALWQHAFLTATLSRQLNRALEMGFQGEEFSAGLSHDIGRLLLAIGAPTYFDRADPMDFVEGPGCLVREREILGTDHCLLGAWFACENKLPRGLVASVQYHHQPGEAKADGQLVALVAIADHLANFLQRGEDGDEYDPAISPGWSILSRDWSAARTTAIRAALPNAIRTAIDETENAQLVAVA